MTIQNAETFHLRAQKVKTTLYSITNGTKGKYCSVAFIWMVASYDFIDDLKS